MRIVRLPHYRGNRQFAADNRVPRFALLNGKRPWMNVANVIDEVLWRQWMGNASISHENDPYYTGYSS